MEGRFRRRGQSSFGIYHVSQVQSRLTEKYLPVLASTFTVSLNHIGSTAHGSSHDLSRGASGGRSRFAVESDTGRSECIVVFGRSRSGSRGGRGRGSSYVDGSRAISGSRSSWSRSRVLVLVLVCRGGSSCESLLTVVGGLGLCLGHGRSRGRSDGKSGSDGDSLGLHLNLAVNTISDTVIPSDLQRR